MIGTVRLPPREPLSSTEAIQLLQDTLKNKQPLEPIALQIAEESRERPLFSWTQFWSAITEHAPRFRSPGTAQVLEPLLTASCRDSESLSAASRFLTATASPQKLQVWGRLLQKSDCANAHLSLAEWKQLALEFKSTQSREQNELTANILATLALKAPYARDLFDANSRSFWLNLINTVSPQERAFEITEFVRKHGDENLIRSSREYILQALKKPERMAALIERTGLDRARRLIVQALSDSSAERKAIITSSKQTVLSLEVMIQSWDTMAQDPASAPQEVYQAYRNLLWFLADFREQVPSAAAAQISTYATLQERVANWVAQQDANTEFLLTHPSVNAIDREWFLLQTRPQLWSLQSDIQTDWDRLTQQRTTLWKNPNTSNQDAFCSVLTKLGIQPERAIWQAMTSDERRDLVLSALNQPMCLYVSGHAQSAHETLDLSNARPTHARGWSVNSVIQLPAIDVTLRTQTDALPFLDLSAHVRPLPERPVPQHHVSEHALALPFAVGFFVDGAVQFFPMSVSLRAATDSFSRPTVLKDAPLVQGIQGGSLILKYGTRNPRELRVIPFQSAGGPGEIYADILKGGSGASAHLDDARLYTVMSYLQDEEIYERSPVEIKALPAARSQNVCELRTRALSQLGAQPTRELPHGIFGSGALYFHEELIAKLWQESAHVQAVLKEYCGSQQVHIESSLSTTEWMKACTSQVLADRVLEQLNLICQDPPSYDLQAPKILPPGSDSPVRPEGPQGKPGSLTIENQL